MFAFDHTVGHSCKATWRILSYIDRDELSEVDPEQASMQN